MTEITVAIPTYNRKDLLLLTLESALRQEGVAFEVIVIDNASTDGTVELVESLHDPRVSVLTSEENVGLVGNFNRALAAGTAPFVTVLHDDDLLRPGSLALRAELLRSDESMVVAYSPYGVIDAAGAQASNVYRCHIPSGGIEQPYEYLRAALRGEVRCHMSAALIRRSLLGETRCKVEDDSFTDYGLWMRLACAGSFGFLPLPLADVRVHASAGAAMGNFRLDAHGVVVPFATEQILRTLEVARRVLSDTSLNVPSRTKLRLIAEVEAAKRLGLAVAIDLNVPGTSFVAILRRTLRSAPSATLSPRFWRGVGVRVRDKFLRKVSS